MSKKAQAEIIIKIILGLIIALVIFIPACKIVNDALRLSGQGLTSFNQLADNINEVNAGNSGDSVATPVFMDKDTAIIGFEKNVDDVKLFGIPYLRPGVCPKEKSCLVLCRHTESVSQGRGGTAIRCRDIKMDEFRIFQFELKGFYDQNSCTNGCEGGFVIARNPLGFSITELPRERVVYADKADSFVALCENRDQEKGCVGFSQVSAPAQPPTAQPAPAPDKVYKKMPPRDKTPPAEMKPDTDLCNKENEGFTACGDSDGQSLYICKRQVVGLNDYKYIWERYASGPFNSPVYNCRTDADYRECKTKKVSYSDTLYAECKLKSDDACYNDVWYVDAPNDYVVWGSKEKGICLLCEKGKWSYIDKRYCENAVATPPD